MQTFQTAIDTLLDWANRSAGAEGMTASAKQCINNAIIWANRSHAFRYAERAAECEYGSGVPLLQYESAGLTDCLGLTSCQIKLVENSMFGNPLTLETHNSLFQQIKNQKDLGNGLNGGQNMARLTTKIGPYKIFIIGQAFGLFPTPQENVTLLLTYQQQLPRLVNPTDTNFLLNFGFDFIIQRAMFLMNYYLKDDQRLAFSAEVMEQEWRALKAWDLGIHNNYANFEI